MSSTNYNVQKIENYNYLESDEYFKQNDEPLIFLKILQEK